MNDQFFYLTPENTARLIARGNAAVQAGEMPHLQWRTTPATVDEPWVHYHFRVATPSGFVNYQNVIVPPDLYDPKDDIDDSLACPPICIKSADTSV